MSAWGPDGEHVICEMGSTAIPEEMGMAPPRYPRDVELANARLIAAAPDLLAACRAALADELESRHNGCFITDGSVEKLRAAIRAATGEG